MAEQGVLKVLIADDTDSDRLILESIVKREGHTVVCARDGVEAVDLFKSTAPDLVLLDALMPRLDGLGAAKQIKALAGEELVPIIFLTSLTDTDSLVKCLEAGGDDFLSKPYNRFIIQAKIKAFKRMREMHVTLHRQRDEIALHNEHLLQEQTVAKQVFDNIAHSGCLDAANVKHLLSPLAVFNGDVLVAGIRPSGNMMVLLGDFTGHGLPAAIGAMPLATSFYGMVQKGFALVDVLREINQKLKSILPIGVFCCACIVDLDFVKRRIKVWNGGLPDCFLHREKTGDIEAVRSTHLPLGVLDDKDFRDDCVHLEMDLGDRFFMWSDGIVESRNHDGGMYGEERLKGVFERNRGSDHLFDDIIADVHDYSGEGCRDDDLTLLELQMVHPDEVHASADALSGHVSTGLMEWALDFKVKPSTFRLFDPLPLLLNILVEVPGLRRHSGSLYTILAELYSNALEHGVLGLQSDWKKSPEGFARYYEERKERLRVLVDGFVSFHLSHNATADGGSLLITVGDSGEGFSHAEKLNNDHKTDGYSGRGIPLIRTLCESLRYIDNGSQVEAVFVWSNDH